MKPQIYNVSTVTLDEEGRPVLSDESLIKLEQARADAAIAGGILFQDQEQAVNIFSCDGTSNGGFFGCGNGWTCDDSLNTNYCDNALSCDYSSNWSGCVNHNACKRL